MTDSEDDKVKELDVDSIYQLKKIGPEASCSKVPDVMRLNLGLTKIGRAQHNDFFLDSMVLKNFISRSHVEIFGKKNENGDIEFVLNDKGLNGTFINDIRTHKTCLLELGDKITFGHTNGYKIEPGSYAGQPNSEFQFIFEKIPSHSKTSEMFQEDLSSDTLNREETTDAQVDQKKDIALVSSDRTFLSDIKSNLQTPDLYDKPAKSKPSHRSRSRKDSSSQSDNEEITDSKNISVTSGSKKSGKGCSESPKNTLAKETDTSKRKASTGGSVSLCSETLPAVEDETQPVEDIGDEEEAEEEEVEEEEVEEEEEEEIQKKKRKVPKRGKGTASSQKKSGSSTRGKKAPVVREPSESKDSSDNEEPSKPKADQKLRSHSSRPKPSQNKKRRSLGNNAPAVGSRRKRRRNAATSSTATSAQGDNLEPGVEWCEEETCDSADCKRPKKKRTLWVQCDICDGWYHTVCVGANYNALKDSDADFSCGCVPD